MTTAMIEGFEEITESITPYERDMVIPALGTDFGVVLLSIFGIFLLLAFICILVLRWAGDDVIDVIIDVINDRDNEQEENS